mmetsp:Transcript_69645/g.163827  ORF Transcript_69645/g.163827 Transcript_69645/m.163827 type:complete len:100 (+) Transcript_69645:170-469(+)
MAAVSCCSVGWERSQTLALTCQTPPFPSFHRPPGSWIRDHASGVEILEFDCRAGVLLPRFHSDETEHEFAAYYRAVNFAHVRALITILVAAALTMNQSV